MTMTMTMTGMFKRVNGQAELEGRWPNVSINSHHAPRTISIVSGLFVAPKMEKYSYNFVRLGKISSKRMLMYKGG